MRFKKLAVLLTVACAALALSGLIYAGGPDCHGKSESAKAAKHDCGGMSPEDCAKAGHAGCDMSAEECAKEMQKAMATRGWLGVNLDMSSDEGITISKVYPDSPAAQVGFQVGDKVTSINGVAVNEDNVEKVHKMLKGAKIGDKVSYQIAREGQNLTLDATLVKMPEAVMAETIDRHMKEDHPVAKN